MRELILPDNQQFFNVSQLQSMGYSYYLINKMVERGMLTKLNKSTYENAAYTGNLSDFSYLSAVAPQAVVCLMSAARFYNLTTYLPDAVDIAIDNSMKISTLPEWPSFHIYYFSKDRYETGIVTANDGITNFRIYDIEKTVADILGYRNKIGIEETGEILRAYLSKKERNINQLHRYASALGAEAILRTYLEVLL